jgi:acyl-coenzyme A thioesterase PaaI-like protein
MAWSGASRPAARGMRGGMSKKKYGVVSPEVLNSQSGLEFLKAIIAGTVPQPPISETLGFHLVEAETGRAAFEGVPEFRYYNPIGTVHRGRTVATSEGDLKDRAGKLYAHATTTCMIFPAKA